MRKLSLPFRNVANLVAEHIARTWPELSTNPIANVWFTGSQVWRHLYPAWWKSLDAPADWDIFTIGDDASDLVVDRFDLTSLPSVLTRDKRHVAERTICDRHRPRLAPPEDGVHPAGYQDGYCYATPRGELDLWVSATRSAVDELCTYPQFTHDHCRAAFSFDSGLLVLPNGAAR